MKSTPFRIISEPVAYFFANRNGYPDLLFRLGVFEDFINGVWSGFPICCVLGYCIDIIHGIKPAKHRYDSHGVIWGLTTRKIDKIQYVQCNRCFEHTIREVGLS